MWYHFLCWPWSPTKVMFIWFLHFSFPFCNLWKEVTMYSSYLNSGSYAPLPWERKYLPKLFGIFLCRRFIISSHVFIYPMIYSYLYGFMDIIYTYTYTLGYCSVQCYCCSGLFQFWTFQLACFPLTFTSFCLLSTSLCSDTIKCSRLILYDLFLSHRISHFSKKHWFLLL